jgi:hypothetical protein
MDRELTRKQYDFEIDQRNALASAINIPIVAITVVASAASAVVLDFSYELSPRTYAFALCMTTAMAAVVFSVYSVFRSFWNYEYQKLSSPKALTAHYNELIAWHKGQGQADEVAVQNAKADYETYVYEHLSEAADWNGQNNLARGNYLHRATAAIAIAVACFVPAALLYAHARATSPEKIYQVRVLVQPATQGDTKMATTPSPSPSAPAPAPTPAAAPPASLSVKPGGPPNVIFKSSTELSKPSIESNTPKKP